MANRKIGSLLVSVGADTKQLKEGLRDAEQQASKFGRTSSRVATRSRSSFASMAAVAGTAALGTVGAIAGAGLAGAAIVGRAIDGIPSVRKQMDQIRRQTELATLGARIDADPAAAQAMSMLNPVERFAELFHEFQMFVGKQVLNEDSLLRRVADGVEELVAIQNAFFQDPTGFSARSASDMAYSAQPYIETINTVTDVLPGAFEQFFRNWDPFR